MRAILPLLLLSSLTLAACGSEPAERGVAAKVNGRPIPVKLLEFAHSLSLSNPMIVPGDALSGLRAEYGQALAGLIAEELVSQELARRGLEVTPAEVKEAETTARAGYPGGSFEDVLAGEGLDQAEVLRPRVSISPEEAQQYYREHSLEFSRPVGVKYLKVESKTGESLGKALKEASGSSDPAGILSVFSEVAVQAQASPEEALPKPWRDMLAGLKPGQASRVGTGGLGFQAFILLERTPARTEGLVQVYQIVEKRLIEAKLKREYESWLTQALNASVIELSPGLTPGSGKF